MRVARLARCASTDRLMSRQPARVPCRPGCLHSARPLIAASGGRSVSGRTSTPIRSGRSARPRDRVAHTSASMALLRATHLRTPMSPHGVFPARRNRVAGRSEEGRAEARVRNRQMPDRTRGCAGRPGLLASGDVDRGREAAQQARWNRLAAGAIVAAQSHRKRLDIAAEVFRLRATRDAGQHRAIRPARPAS